MELCFHVEVLEESSVYAGLCQRFSAPEKCHKVDMTFE